MKFFWHTIFLLVLGQSLVAQNFIPNYSFEDTTLRITPLYLPANWKAATNEGWNYYTPLQNNSEPDWGSPNNLNGFQEARTGSSYIGMELYSLFGSNPIPIREYLQVKLSKTLQFDSTYCFQIYLSLADSAQFASKGIIGVYFSANAISGNHTVNLPFTPQLLLSPNQYITDRKNWVKLDMEYKAMGGEEYITIGNFFDTTFIDTVFVPGGGDQFWMETSYYYMDDVWLSHCDSIPDSLVGLPKNNSLKQMSVYPNPFQDIIQIDNKTNKELTIRLVNALGQDIPIKSNYQGQQIRIVPGDIPKGLYWLLVDDGKFRESFKLIKN